MALTPSVSVVIPTYNRRDLLPDAIDSVLAQTFEDYEIIVVDHGSTDRTAEMLKDVYADRVRCISLPNCELPACARNAGIRSARGDYITFLDSDDRWLPRKLEKQVNAAARHPDAALFYSLAEKFGSVSRRRMTMRGHYRPSGRVFNILLFYNFIPTLTVMVRRQVLDEVGLFDLRPDFRAVEDYDLWLRIARRRPVRYIPEVLAQYRVHPDNLSHDILSGFDRIERVVRKALEENGSPGFLRRKVLSHLDMGRFEFSLLSCDREEEVLPHLQRAVKTDPSCLTGWTCLLLLRCVRFGLVKRVAVQFGKRVLSS